MAKHGLANFTSVAGQTLAGALPGILTLNPLLAIGGGTAGAANATYQNVKAHRERKKAEDMAKKALNPKDKKKKGSFWEGEQARTEQLPLHAPEQIAARNALLPGVVEKIGSNQFDFGPIEEQSNRNFQRNVVPTIASRFARTEGGPSTSAYRQALASASAEHQSGLDVLRQQYGIQQQTQNQNLFSTLMQPAHENLYFPQQPGFKQRLAEGLAGSAGNLLNTGIQTLGTAGAAYLANRQQPQPIPATPQAPGTAPQTIGAASTPQGQAAQAVAQSAQPVSQLGGAGANVAKQGGLSTAGKVGLGLGAGVGTYALTQYFTDLLRRG